MEQRSPVHFYDLKTSWDYGDNGNNYDISLRITDDSINVSGKDAKADIYVNPDSSNWGDSWGLNIKLRTVYTGQYKNLTP